MLFVRWSVFFLHFSLCCARCYQNLLFFRISFSLPQFSGCKMRFFVNCLFYRLNFYFFLFSFVTSYSSSSFTWFWFKTKNKRNTLDKFIVNYLPFGRLCYWLKVINWLGTACFIHRSKARLRLASILGGTRLPKRDTLPSVKLWIMCKFELQSEHPKNSSHRCEISMSEILQEIKWIDWTRLTVNRWQTIAVLLACVIDEPS